MTKHHFVAQTYLKHFGDAARGGMLHAYRKSDGAYFSCWPKDVCHEWDGDLNPAYFPHRPEVLGDFRAVFERHWSPSVASMLSRKLTDTEKFVVAMNMAHLMTCTPTSRRIAVDMHNKLLQGYLSFSKKMKEKHGGNDELPVEAIELIEKGRMSIHTNPDYVKAMTTKQLLEATWELYHQNWMILENDTEHPFTTSDNPVAFEQVDEIAAPRTNYLPITPRLCISVLFDHRRVKRFDRNNPKPDLQKPSLGTVRGRAATSGEAKEINRLVTQCAEDLVFSSRPSVGITALVNKYARYRVEADYIELPAKAPDTIYQGTIMRVRKVGTAGTPRTL